MADKTLEQISIDLARAHKDYAEAMRESDAARHRATCALNALNTVQKTFDAEVVEQRKAHGPRGSDWAETNNRKVGPCNG